MFWKKDEIVFTFRLINSNYDGPITAPPNLLQSCPAAASFSDRNQNAPLDINNFEADNEQGMATVGQNFCEGIEKPVNVSLGQ